MLDFSKGSFQQLTYFTRVEKNPVLVGLRAESVRRRAASLSSVRRCRVPLYFVTPGHVEKNPVC